MSSGNIGTITIICGMTLLLASCGKADDENSFAGAFNTSFDESWEKGVVEGCVEEAEKSGADQADVKQVCECLAVDLAERLDGLSEKVNPPQEKIEAATKKCFGNLE